MAQDTVAIRIKERAHQIWLDAGKPDGKHEQHWERARQEIEAEGEQKLFENRSDE